MIRKIQVNSRAKHCEYYDCNEGLCFSRGRPTRNSSDASGTDIGIGIAWMDSFRALPTRGVPESRRGTDETGDTRSRDGWRRLFASSLSARF